MRVAIIGVGNMGGALAAGLLKKGIVKKQQLILANPNLKKLSSFKKRGVVISSDNREAASQTEVAILAVKPQVLKEVVLEIKGVLPKKCLIVSVAAGVTIESVKKWLKRDDLGIVRVMPNLPAKIGRGIAGWVAAKEVGKRQKSIVRKILSSLGDEIEFESEADLDKVTAISGSGPAYFYYFVEGLIEAGESLGLSKRAAARLALQTFFGSAELLKTARVRPLQLRKAVTSKGGTTEKALEVFEEKYLKRIIQEAVKAANKKARELTN